jgi:hypothetical protein
MAISKKIKIKTMKGKLINNFKKWSTKGILPEEGLCTTLRYTPYEATLNLFNPTFEDFRTLHEETKPTTYWGYGIEYNGVELKKRHRGLTPLRQTILAFICVMHDEV